MPSKRDYTVGWVAALHEELAAARLMLDETHPAQSQPSSDPNAYTLGRISSYNVVIACLPAGNYGTNEAAAVVSNMKATFPNLEYFLMIGIGGGAPSAAHDIRLGDVVVSKPTGQYGGVVQYDFGKALAGKGFHRTGMLNQPPYCLLTRMTYLQAEDMGPRTHCLKAVLEERMGRATDRQRKTYERPDPVTDILFPAEYIHLEERNHSCARCDKEQLVERSQRASSDPQVHYGLIGSANQVMRDGILRDNLAKNHGDIICFEMEAAGLMNQVPCLVIRGICDYADSHKNKHWQSYAAFTAAAYARLLLSVVTAARPPEEERETSMYATLPRDYGWSNLVEEHTFNAEQSECLKSLRVTDPTDDRNALIRTKGKRVPGTSEWILETTDVKEWLRPGGSNILWLHGNPGTGKTTIAITLTEELPKLPYFRNEKGDLAYFFCDSSSTERRTANGILRGLLHQLITNRPELMPYLMKRYQTRGDRLFESFDALWQILMDLGSHSRCQYYIVDALDECDPDSQETLLTQINVSFSASVSSTSKPSFLIISRPYPEIREQLEEFNNKDLSSYRKLKTDLDAYIETRVAELARKKRYTRTIAESVSIILREKAGGTFLWVGLACSGLASFGARDAVKKLQGYPRGLHQLYQRMLDSALAASNSDEEMIIKVLESVAIALRPLRISDLAEACELYETELEEERLIFVQQNVDECRLLVVLQGVYVRLLHQSVKDFLLGDGESCRINQLAAHASLARTCIAHIISHCTRSGDRKAEDIVGKFLEYAVLYWPEHASLARQQFEITEELKDMFQTGPTGLQRWLNLYNQIRKHSQLPEGFSIFHVAARWGIVPLLDFAMSERKRESSDDSFSFEDVRFATEDGVSPIEEAANAGQVEILRSLLRANPSISQSAVLAAVSNEKYGDILLATVAERLSEGMEITPELVEAAAHNRGKGKEIIRLLFERYGQNVSVTEKALIAAAQNQGVGKTVMRLFLERASDKAEVTEEVAVAAAGNWTQGPEMLKLLLEVGKRSETCTAEVLEAAARNRVCGKELVEFLLHQGGKELEVAEEVWIAAAGNEGAGKDIISLLLQKGYGVSEITADLVEAAISEDVIMLFLCDEHCRIRTTSGAVTIAVERFSRRLAELLQIHQRLEPEDLDEMSCVSLRSAIDAGSTPGSTPSPITENRRRRDHIPVHTGPIFNIALAPKTNLLASASSDMLVHVWDAVTGTLVHTVERWPEFVRISVISPDHQYIVSALRGGAIRIDQAGYYIRSGSMSSELMDSNRPMKREITSCSGSINALDISKDGETIAAGYENKSLILWDFRTGGLKAAFESHSAAVTAVAFSAHNSWVASGSRDSHVRVWDVVTRDQIPLKTYSHPPGTVTAIVFSPDGTLLAAGNENGSLVVWNNSTSAVLHLLDAHSASIIDLDISQDMAQLASASCDTTTKIWDIATGQLNSRIAPRSMGPPKGVSKIRFLPKSTLLVSGSRDGTVRIWSDLGASLATIGSPSGPVDDLNVRDDGVLSTVSEFVFKTCQLREYGPWSSRGLRAIAGRESLELAPQYADRGRRKRDTLDYSLCFAPDGKVLATGGHSSMVRLWCCETGRLLHSLSGHHDRNTSLAFSPDGNTLASGSLDASVVIWNATTGKLSRRLFGHVTKVIKIVFSENGTVLASTSSDGYIQLWSSSSWTLLQAIRLEDFSSTLPCSIDFTSDCRFAVFGLQSGGWGVWHSNTDSIELHNQMSISADNIRFTPSASAVVTAFDDHVMFWQPTRGIIIDRVGGHTDKITEVAFSRDGSRLATSSKDGSIRLWDVESMTLLNVLRGEGSGALSLAFSSEGTILASGFADGSICIWKLDSE
jgi:WD40 repeat protein/nucleoside phosphorylase